MIRDRPLCPYCESFRIDLLYRDKGICYICRSCGRFIDRGDLLFRKPCGCLEGHRCERCRTTQATI